MRAYLPSAPDQSRGWRCMALAGRGAEALCRWSHARRYLAAQAMASRSAAAPLCKCSGGSGRNGPAILEANKRETSRIAMEQTYKLRAKNQRRLLRSRKAAYVPYKMLCMCGMTSLPIPIATSETRGTARWRYRSGGLPRWYRRTRASVASGLDHPFNNL